MANFSTLFPNLQDNLDFTVGDATGSANQIYGWAQADDTTVIPSSKLPNLSSGTVFTGTSTSATAALALADFVAAFNAATGAAAGVVNGITVPAGSTITAGDRAIITDANAGGAETETYIYVGADVTAPADIVVGDFRDLTHSGDVVDTITEGANIALSGGTEIVTGTRSGAVTVALDAALIDITSIVPASGADLTLGTVTANEDTIINGATVDINSAGAVTVDGSQVTFGTFDIGATTNNINVQFNALNYNVSSTGVNFNDAEGNTAGFNVNSTGNTSISGNFSSFSGTGQTTIGSTGSNTILQGAETRLAAVTSVIEHGTDAEPNVLGIGADGRLQTVGVVTGGGAYTVNPLTDAVSQSIVENQVNLIPTLATTGRTYTIAGDLPTGTWVKIVNRAANSTNQATISLNQNTGSVDQEFLDASTTPTTLVLNDTSANFEIVKVTATEWAILAT